MSMAKPAQNSNAICILGMHRSGTSVITRAVNLLGVYLGEGKDLIPAIEYNPEGIWERIDFNGLQERLLATMKRTWDTTVPLHKGWQSAPEVKPFRDEIASLIKVNFSGIPLWAWKDPRSTIFLALWKDILKDLKIDLSAVFMVRNPLDVARSLQKRDAFSLDKGFGVWFNYNITALQAVRGIPAVFVLYDKFLGDWEPELRRVAQALGISWPQDPTALREKMNSFVRPELRHSISTADELQDVGAPLPVVQLYEIFQRLIEGVPVTDQSISGPLASLSADFNAYGSFFVEDMAKSWERGVKLSVRQRACQLFIDTGNGFEAGQWRWKNVTGKEKELEFDISTYPEIKGLRFDPLDDSVIIRVDEIAVIDKTDKVFYPDICQSNALEQNGNEYIFSDHDPQLYLQAQVIQQPKAVKIKLEYLAIGQDAYDSIFKVSNEQITDKNRQLSLYHKYLEERDRHLLIKTQQLEERDRQLIVTDKALRLKDEELALIRNSGGWKVLLKCYGIRDKIFPLNSKRRRIAKKFLKLLRRRSFFTRGLAKDTLVPAGTSRGLFALILRTAANPKKIFKNLRISNLKKFIYYLKYSDSATIKEKIRQKLSGQAGQNGPEIKCKPDFQPGVSNEDYFDFLFKMNACGGPEYVPLSCPDIPETDIRLIAFYLPQFHPIAENDEWWGKGFTEWTNVSKAVPQFVGHYQPRLPGELGFYDLRLPEIQKRQVELAKLYGVYGFCFHFYWFHGKTLLERPLEMFLANQDLDFPFCINWANENWSRKWDGRDDDVLIAQAHSPEDDLAFIEHVSKYLRDPRYIKVNSKPLLMVYRPALLPNAKETASRWRAWCRENGIGEIYLVLTHSFEHIDPHKIGFDAAVEFPPNTFPFAEINSSIQFTNNSFKGRVLDYGEAVDLARQYRRPSYTKFRCVCPSWDNEARKPGAGTVLANASPDKYKDWLKLLCDFTSAHFSRDERLVFINAWNEWAEGAYIEPDRKYGYAYLESTAKVLSSFSENPPALPGKRKILFVSHDASKGGAQSVLLNIISWFKEHTSIDLKILCIEGGGWLPEFQALGDTLVMSELKGRGLSAEEIIGQVREFGCGGPDLIYCNSVTSGKEYPLLGRLNVPLITHVHELEMSIKHYASACVDNVVKYSSHFVACSKAVRENLIKNYAVDEAKITTVYASISPDKSISIADDNKKRELRRKLGLEKNKFTVLGCGVGMPFRKGADLFLDVARRVLQKGITNFHFYWIGNFDKTAKDEAGRPWADYLEVLKKGELKNYVTFLGDQDDPREFFQAGDIFLLPSREDPFPLVVLEAAECGLPAVCFADAGGMPDFVGNDAGFVTPYCDAEAMADKVILLKRNRDIRDQLGGRAREKLLNGFTFEQTAPPILSICRTVARKKPAVSIIVPNYNHGKYLPKRLQSIFNQTFKDFEVILLDDASTDNSIDVLMDYQNRNDVRLIRNEANTGSPCSQWLKGIDLAAADIIWIAESDDVCEPEFLAALMPAFRNPSVRLAYSDSFVIDENDKITGDYVGCEYLTSLSATKWKKNYLIDANDEINDGLGVKNTILNISAAIFRKPELSDELRKRLASMRIAGDWYFIANAIYKGKIQFEARKLNYHRRHSESVIGKTLINKKAEDFFEEFYIVQEFIFNNYQLKDSFLEKWECYIRKLWNDFYPNRPFEEITEYYPIHNLKQKDVHVGKDGWLFLKRGSNNLLEYYRNPDLFDGQLIKKWIDLLEQRINFCSQNAMEYLHLIVPDKLTIYSEYFSGHLDHFDGSPLQKISKELGDIRYKNILSRIINPIKDFNAKKNQELLYWKTDTHWTFYGAYYAYQLICDRLNVSPNSDILTRKQNRVRLALDLGSKMDPVLTEEAGFCELTKDAKRVHANKIVLYKEANGLENDGGLHIGSHVIFRNEGALSSKKVVVFGDSFSEYRTHLLTGMLAETFNEVHFVWSTSLDKEYIKKISPDILITEIAERFMPCVPDDNFNLEEYCIKKLKKISG